MKNKETLTDEHYLREVSEKWNRCPICGSESGFEIKKGRYASALSVCNGMMLTCKNCSAEWRVDRPFFFAGKIKGLILRKPELEDWEKKRPVVIKQRSEIAEENLLENIVEMGRYADPCNLHFTDERVTVEHLQNPKGSYRYLPGVILAALGYKLVMPFSWIIGGAIMITGGMFVVRKMNENPHERDYAISYNDIETIILEKKITYALGYSNLVIKSWNGNAQFRFKKENFNHISSFLSDFFPDKVEMK